MFNRKRFGSRQEVTENHLHMIPQINIGLLQLLLLRIIQLQNNQTIQNLALRRLQLQEHLKQHPQDVTGRNGRTIIKHQKRAVAIKLLGKFKRSCTQLSDSRHLTTIRGKRQSFAWIISQKTEIQINNINISLTVPIPVTHPQLFT